MSATMTAQFVTDALVMAIWSRGKPRALLHHSDRGSQYTSEQFQRLTADHGVPCSMSRSGICWYNAALESRKAERRVGTEGVSSRCSSGVPSHLTKIQYSHNPLQLTP